MSPSSDNYMLLKLNKIVCSLAAGLTIGFMFFVLAVWAMLLPSESVVGLAALFSSVMPGYSVSIIGCLVALLYGFVFGAVMGFVFAFFFNEITRHIYYKTSWKSDAWAAKIDEAINPDIESEKPEEA